MDCAANNSDKVLMANIIGDAVNERKDCFAKCIGKWNEIAKRYKEMGDSVEWLGRYNVYGSDSIQQQMNKFDVKKWKENRMNFRQECLRHYFDKVDKTFPERFDLSKEFCDSEAQKEAVILAKTEANEVDVYRFQENLLLLYMGQVKKSNGNLCKNGMLGYIINENKRLYLGMSWDYSTKICKTIVSLTDKESVLLSVERKQAGDVFSNEIAFDKILFDCLYKNSEFEDIGKNLCFIERSLCEKRKDCICNEYKKKYDKERSDFMQRKKEKERRERDLAEKEKERRNDNIERDMKIINSF